MQFFKGGNKKDKNNNSNDNGNKSSEGEGQGDTEKHDNNLKMQESDLLNELDQLASQPTTSAEFSDDPQHAAHETGGTVMDAIVAGVANNLAPNSSSHSAAGGVESLKMLDSDDGADMDIFDDDEDDIAAKSPGSWVANVGGPKKKVSPALREEIQDLLKTPLTIPTLVQPKGRKDDYDDDDDDGDDDKSSESGEDYTDDEDEGESGYKPGGYHPVNVGDIFNQG
jgi:hypothetical protein